MCSLVFSSIPYTNSYTLLCIALLLCIFNTGVYLKKKSLIFHYALGRIIYLHMTILSCIHTLYKIKKEIKESVLVKKG